MTARLMTRQELFEFYQLMGMAGQCIIVNGEQVEIKSNVLPQPAATQKTEKPNDG